MNQMINKFKKMNEIQQNQIKKLNEKLNAQEIEIKNEKDEIEQLKKLLACNNDSTNDDIIKLRNLVIEQQETLNKQKNEYDEIIEEQRSQIQNLTNDIKELKKMIQNNKTNNECNFIAPFGIKNIGDSFYINSSLQCFLSLSSFINELDSLISESKTEPILLSIFKKFITSHNPSELIQFFEKTDQESMIRKHNSIDFINSFINIIQKESPKSVTDLFIGNRLLITNCTKCLIESKISQNFSSISMSMNELRKILYIPFSFKKNPIYLTEPPEVNSQVTIRDRIFFQHEYIGNYILVAKDIAGFKAIDNSIPHLSDIYAFELPENIEMGYGFIIVQLKDNEHGHITKPFICEIPVYSLISENELKDIILYRLKELLGSNYKSKFNVLKKSIQFSKLKRFPCKFSLDQKMNGLCSQYVTVVLPKIDATYFAQKTIQDQQKNISLSQLFDGHIKQSQLNQPHKFKCEYCEFKTNAFRRTKYTKLPKILIFHVDRICNGSSIDNTRVTLPHFVSIDLDGKFDVIKTDDDINGSDIKYELKAVINNTAITKRGDKWYALNNGCVKEESEPTGPNENTYVAFYQQLS